MKVKTKQDAINEMLEFIDICKLNNVKEKSFHLYQYNGEYIIIADSVKNIYGRGKHIDEFKL